MSEVKEKNIPEQYEPISMWGYLGYSILFALPIIGVIMILVFSFSKDENINVRNYAKSYILVYVIGVILYLILALCFKEQIQDLIG